MKLTNEDKELLMDWGHPKEDLKQIERATSKTIYTLDSGEKISASEALTILGRNVYLSGISRSAFHWTSYRESEKGQSVHFDSSRLFQ